jgi:serine/threonine protein kinase
MTDSGIFKAAIQLAPEQRQAFLDQACGTNQELRQEVESLLKSHEAPGSFLTSPAFETPPNLEGTANHQPLVERPGTVIGPYKLLEQIGEGGMGIVYLAEQQPVRRQVALKLIKPGMDSKQVLARFEAERQALALMNHPHIAKVHDPGSTPTGLPYFVMELVPGAPITRFCDDNFLSIPQRLELFVQVCQAIQHAHQKGIIHRDIKPSNILVTRSDDTLVAKVIDFGIAKAIDQRLTDKTLDTQVGGAVGTFEYMSPEQAELSAQGVDTRSDIYSLGVLLYELLTGTTPLEPQRLKGTSYGEILRLIKEEEPPCPSKRLSASDGQLPMISRQRGIDPAKLVRRVRGELDWIVMKCLDKDRSRRYETANALVRDVQRHLTDEPVEARPPSTGYRLRKFLRRNRGPVAVTGLVFMLLVVGIIGTTLGLFRARKARDNLRMALAQQLADRLKSDFKQLEKIGQAIEAALAQNEWDEEQIIAFFKPLLRQDERLFGLGVAVRPFHVPPTSQRSESHLQTASTVGFLCTPSGAGSLLAASNFSSTGYCLYVYKADPHVLAASTVGLMGTPSGPGPLLAASACFSINTDPYKVDHYPSYMYDHRMKDWFKKPLINGKAFWTPICGLDEAEMATFNTALITYVVPLRRNGEIVGVMCVDIAIKDFFADNQLSNRLKDVNFGKSSYAFVVSNSQRIWNGLDNKKKGVFISHPNLVKPTFQYPNGILQLTGVTPRFKQLAQKFVKGEEQGVGRAKDPWTKHESTFLFVPLKSEGWTAEMTLVVVIDET